LRRLAGTAAGGDGNDTVCKCGRYYRICENGFQDSFTGYKKFRAIKSCRLTTKPDKDDSVFSIPEGSVIHHTSDGVTKVYDKDGNGLFSANDRIL